MAAPLVKDVRVICSDCGSSFYVDRCHQYVTRCPGCRPQRRPLSCAGEALDVPAAQARLKSATEALRLAADGTDEDWLAARLELHEAFEAREAALRAEARAREASRA